MHYIDVWYDQGAALDGGWLFNTLDNPRDSHMKSFSSIISLQQSIMCGKLLVKIANFSFWNQTRDLLHNLHLHVWHINLSIQSSLLHKASLPISQIHDWFEDHFGGSFFLVCLLADIGLHGLGRLLGLGLLTAFLWCHAGLMCCHLNQKRDAVAKDEPRDVSASFFCNHIGVLQSGKGNDTKLITCKKKQKILLNIESYFSLVENDARRWAKHTFTGRCLNKERFSRNVSLASDFSCHGCARLVGVATPLVEPELLTSPTHWPFVEGRVAFLN